MDNGDGKRKRDDRRDANNRQKIQKITLSPQRADENDESYASRILSQMLVLAENALDQDEAVAGADPPEEAIAAAVPQEQADSQEAEAAPSQRSADDDDSR